MNAPRVCGKCGVPLGSDTLAGLCPGCMLLSALSPDSDAPTIAIEDEAAEVAPLPDSPVLSRFGDYELLEELAHGGMGVVYRARQVKLDRIVAIKMLLLGQRASDEVVERFKREAQSAAHLRHPNIVAIHEVGEVEGQPFFSMDFVQGKDLSKIVREQPLPARQAATYVRTVAEAIHYAHQQGIIHRDLKPSNILLDFTSDEVRVTDFGIAKRLDAHSDLTLSGQVMGSPSHMAPELAAGHHGLASPASDVFSLGAVLYELLTGRPPFLADSLQATLLKIRDTDPVAPRELNAGIPRDLETICLKCLEKEPGARFASAHDLADELGRFLRGEPIRTRPVGVIEKTWRWGRRQPVLAGLAAGIVVLAMVSTVTAVNLAVARQRQEREQYYAEIGLAQKHIEAGDIGKAMEILMDCPVRYRHWEWGHLLYLCHQDIRTIPAHTNALSMFEIRYNDRIAPMVKIVFSPDTRSLLTLGIEGKAKVWDLADGRELFACGNSSNRVTEAVFSPDGNRLAVVEGNRVIFRDARTGLAQFALADLPARPALIAWSPSGQQLVVGMEDGAVEIRSATNGSRGLSIPGGSGPLLRLYYTSDGLRLVRQDARRCASFDAGSGRELEGVNLDPVKVVAAVPDPEMHRFVGWDREALITLWEGSLPAQALDRTFGRDEGQPHAVFSPDGRRFATRSNAGTSKVWDATTRRPLFVVPDRVYTMAFSPDGQRLVTAGNKTVAHVWDIENGREVRALRGHQELVELVAFSPDGRLVATGARDGMVKLWSATDGREVVCHPTIPWGVTLSRDGRRFTTGPVHDGVTVRESASGRGFLKLKVAGDYLPGTCFSPDGTRLLTSSRFRQPRVWDVATGRLLLTLEGHTRGVLWGLAYSPDGRRIATSGYDQTTRLWDAETGRQLQVVDGYSECARGAAFSPDSRLLATVNATAGFEAVISDVETGKCLRRIRAHEGGCQGVAFSPDGSRVVTTGLDNTIRFWDVRSGELKQELRLRGYAEHTSFSPDGKRLFCYTEKLAYLGQDIPAFEIWDVEMGRLILTLGGHEDVLNWLDISADGKHVLTSGCDGTVRQWQCFPWAESEYPGQRGTPVPVRVRAYADQYWRERLTAEAPAPASATPMRVVEIPFDRSLILPRARQTPLRQLDLTRHYTSPLDRPFQPSFGLEDNDLRSLAPGVAEYAGVVFDVRGVIQLRRFHLEGPLFQLGWGEQPVRVDGIPVQQKVRRLHLLHGTSGRELDGTVIANLVWHYADGQQRESEVVYGRHVRDWWRLYDSSELTNEARIGWEGTNPATTDPRVGKPSGDAGKEVRLYVSGWENSRPEVEVTTLDLVSREAQSGPFVLAITVE